MYATKFKNVTPNILLNAYDKGDFILTVDWYILYWLYLLDQSDIYKIEHCPTFIRCIICWAVKKTNILFESKV